jgi:hypothetical protein
MRTTRAFHLEIGRIELDRPTPRSAHIWGTNLTDHNYNKLVLVALFERLKMFQGNRMLSRRGYESVDKWRSLCFSRKCNIRVLLSGSNKVLLCWISQEVDGTKNSQGPFYA